MLIENAFHYLPEILCGSNYALQEYEAGIVNAISLAVLQELNARNVPNPLASLTVEKLYSKTGFDRPDGDTKKRHLRADLFVDTSRTFVATEGLSRFGWRHKNYLESKFFRPGGPASTTNAALLLSDVIRLCCLVPPTVEGWHRTHNRKPSPCDGDPALDGRYTDICVGRYLLHVYEGSPQTLVGIRSRSWVKELRSPAGTRLNIKIGDDKADTFKRTISNDLAELEIDVGFTNRVIAQNQAQNRSHYLCVLTRIDRFTIKLGNLSWRETDTREGVENVTGAWKTLQATIGKHLLFAAKVEKALEDVPPSENELETFDETGDPNLEREEAIPRDGQTET